MSAFIVEAGTAGFDDSKRMDLMAAHPIGEPRWTDCHVPQDNLIGERGRGLRLALGTLDTFRTTVAAAAIGMAQAAYEASLDYAKNREMFGQTLSDFQATQFKLADMAVALDAARLLAHRAAWLKGLRSRVHHQGGVIRQVIRNRGREPYHKRRGPDSRRCRIGEG
ncbi:MAG: hypothetical protein Ct9H300mP11_20980 [Chloroflexota bacterium]|nr:MAG: hypothetical protein Ct9H300mP11_20980 [Chloroflexota bacterium]